MTMYWTADWHRRHKNILQYSSRPFSSIEEHDQALVDNHNAIVQDDDMVFCLGDMSFNKGSTIALRQLLKGKLYLIPGNHDPVHPRYGKKAEKVKEEYEAAGWVVCNINAKIVAFGDEGKQYSFWMNHLPPDNKDPRFTKFLPPPDQPGVIYLCGHVHTAWKVNGNAVNVGVDQWNYKPVSSDELLELITKENLPLDTSSPRQ